MNFKRIILFISAISLIVMTLLNAVSLAVFGNMEYYRKEFEKHTVTDNIDMDMDDIMYVMDELMAYLNGDRENLENIITEVNGETRDFFSQREKIHMEDCKVIFDAAFKIRTASTIIFYSFRTAVNSHEGHGCRKVIIICRYNIDCRNCCGSCYRRCGGN